MISMRRRLLLMLALILLVTQLISAFWLWHESQEQISFLVDETLSAKARNEQVDKEIAEAIASLLAPSLIMMTITLLLSFWAISWIIRPLDQLQQKLAERSADNLSPWLLTVKCKKLSLLPQHSINCYCDFLIPFSKNGCLPPMPPMNCVHHSQEYAST